MRNWAGLVLFAVGALLAYSGLAQRARVVAARRLAAAGGEAQPGRPPGNPSLAMMADIMPPIILFALAFVGLKVIFAYVVMDGGRAFSLFDLAGFLFLLAGYGLWIVLKTRYRESAIATGPVGVPRLEAGEPPLRVPSNPAR